VILGQNKCT